MSPTLGERHHELYGRVITALIDVEDSSAVLVDDRVSLGGSWNPLMPLRAREGSAQRSGQGPSLLVAVAGGSPVRARADGRLTLVLHHRKSWFCMRAWCRGFAVGAVASIVLIACSSLLVAVTRAGGPAAWAYGELAVIAELLVLRHEAAVPQRWAGTGVDHP